MSLDVMDLVVDEGGVAMACVVLLSSPEALQRGVMVTLSTTGDSAMCKWNIEGESVSLVLQYCLKKALIEKCIVMVCTLP